MTTARASAALIVMVLGCGGRSGGDARKICERAAEKYTGCIEEILGAEAAAMARGKDGIDACARDERTVAMYRECLPASTCEAFMDCLEGVVERASPPIGADLPRAEQCAQHVQDGLAGLGDLDREVRPRYAEQRQRECEAWPPELAACILGLPGKKDCDPDSYPLWRLGLDEGPAGPPVAWSTPVRGDDDDDVDLAWGAGGVLVVRDDDGLRAIRDGEVLWADPEPDAGVALTVAGGWIAAERGSDRGLALYEVATGTRATALDGSYLHAFGAAGDLLLALTEEGELIEIAPAQCRRGARCGKRLGALDEATVHVDRIGAWRDAVVLASTDGIQVTDRRGKTRFTVELAADQVVLAADGAVVVDGRGVAALSPAACGADGAGCVVARHPATWIDRVAALPGGAVAFNDDGLTEQTHHFGPAAATWAANTAGEGEVAGDASHVYVVSLGLDGAGPVRLLALARATGEVAWQTELGVPPPAGAAVRLVVRDRRAAALVGDTIVVTPTAAR